VLWKQMIRCTRKEAMAQRSMGVVLRVRWLRHVGSIFCTLLLAFHGAAIGGDTVGHVTSHGIERDSVNANGTGEGALDISRS
jgi:hypothetical protein